MKRNYLAFYVLCFLLIVHFTACNISPNKPGALNLNVGTVVLTASEKNIFSEACNQIPITNTIEKEELKNLLTKAAFSNAEEITSVHQELAAYGIFYFSGNVENGKATNNNATLHWPAFYYNANSRQWIAICSGYWNTKDWNSYKDEVGSPDSFGIRLNSDDGSYSSYVIDSYAFIADASLSECVSTQNRSDGDGAKGFTFTLQDYVGDSTNGKIYIGTRWFGMCVYDEHFSEYNCSATSFYEHTY